MPNQRFFQDGSPQPLPNDPKIRILELAGPPTAAKHSLALVELLPGGIYPKHRHRQLEESYYLLSGEATVTIDGEQKELAAGEGCVIPVGAWHELRCRGQRALRLLAVCSPPWYPEDVEWG